MVRRYAYLKALASKIGDDVLVVTTLGQTRNEWASLHDTPANFYSVNLGQCTAVGLGLALALPHRKVLVLDSDGNLLLNLGSLVDVAGQSPHNLTIVVLDNQHYESAGRYPSATSRGADLSAVARGVGIRNTFAVSNPSDLEKVIDKALKTPRLFLIVAKIDELGSPGVPYPTFDGKEVKYRFVRYIEESEKVSILAQGQPDKRARVTQG